MSDIRKELNNYRRRLRNALADLDNTVDIFNIDIGLDNRTVDVSKLTDGFSHTADELLLQSVREHEASTRITAALHHAASTGLAIETSMHDINGYSRHVRSRLKTALDHHLDEDRVRSSISGALESFDQIMSSFDQLTKFKKGYFHGLERLTGEKVLADITFTIDAYLRQNKLELRPSPAFLALEFHAVKSNFLPVLSNIVLNAAGWST